MNFIFPYQKIQRQINCVIQYPYSVLVFEILCVCAPETEKIKEYGFQVIAGITTLKIRARHPYSTMKSNRRKFLKMSSIAGLTATGGLIPAFSQAEDADLPFPFNDDIPLAEGQSVIGPYGPWAFSQQTGSIPTHSFRNKQWAEIDTWRSAAKEHLIQRLAAPALGPTPAIKTLRSYTFDGLTVEELQWQLPYGRPTEGILLKPAGSSGRLPGVLAFHDHGGNKYFGTRKITRTGEQHPLMVEHQKLYYSGNAWANDLARRGYVVLISDAFPFASRRVLIADVPPNLRNGLSDNDPENPENIRAYNAWAGQHEHIMAKSLFCAGTTWPGVFFAEDRVALDILCNRADVDPSRVGCCGLSGGGMRTVFMGGLDERIKCAVCVGFMTTWKDFSLNKSYTHTWMTYVPGLPPALDFPEILGLRVPLPALVLNDSEDSLYTLPEMQAAEQILRDVYGKAKAANRFACSYYPGPHKFDDKMQHEAFTWFDRWLKS
jgi:dienelactone hydrolase